MVSTVLRLTLSRWTRAERINLYSIETFTNNFIRTQKQKSKTFNLQQSRSLTSRNGKSYRKGRRKAVSNFDKKKALAPNHVTTTTSTIIAESNNGISSSASSTEVQHTRHNPFNSVSQWISTVKNSSDPPWKVALLALVPKRYRYPQGLCSQMYSYGQGILIAQRLAIWTALVFIMVVCDETSPFELVGIRGPSMIPTMAADGSDLWLCRTYPSWLRQYYDIATSAVLLSLIQPRLQHGSIVGFAHPESPNSAIAMKRIVGLPGDRIQRYGQYVHLYTDQDPDGWGITWPISYDSNHMWIKNRGTTWDVGKNKNASDPTVEVVRTLVVPDGHVWIEADCPALGLDSRQFGPIPISWIRTRVIAKIWPLQVSPTYQRWYHRPHPIPLDVETLLEFNVFYDKVSSKPST